MILVHFRLEELVECFDLQFEVSFCVDLGVEN